MLDTRAPFDASALALEDEISTLIPHSNDAAGDRAGKVRLPRGEDDLRHLASPAPGVRHDQADAEKDPINPSHYRKHPSGIECIEITRHLNFNVGNAIKYLWRHMDKGDPVKNLKKAQWYIDDEIRRL